jgi:hypothetical protein
MKKNQDEFGKIVNPARIEEPAFYETDPVNGVMVAIAKRDYGPLQAMADGKRVVELVQRKIDGKESRLSVVVPTLRTLYRKGSITEDMYRMGLDFKLNYDFSGLEPLRAQDIGRIPGGGFNGGASDAVTDAKDFIFRCWKVLGNKNTIMSRAITETVGREVSLRDIVINEGHDRSFWSGALMSALELMVEKKTIIKKGVDDWQATCI